MGFQIARCIFYVPGEDILCKLEVVSLGFFQYEDCELEIFSKSEEDIFPYENGTIGF